VRARKHRAENRSLHRVNEDSSTELTQLSRKKAIFRGALKHKNGALKEALEKISEIANKDELTGIHNRRSVVAQVTEEYERCMRGTKTFSVVLFDLDFFKSVNDKFGHLIGDSVLRRTAQACQDGLRANDCLGRYGGEEFLLILPNTDLDGALFKAEQLRQRIDQTDFTDLAPGLKVTISIGVSAFSGHESYWDTIERADQALYRAKHDGRNRVCSLT
jgi:diguanylate cyclase